MEIKESNNLDKYQYFAWNTKLTLIPIVVETLRTVPQMPVKELVGDGDQSKNREHPDHCASEIS